jgi:hypothetical protein
VAFYIRKHLESGPIRFAVTTRSIDGTHDDSRLSTGPHGEYRPVRRAPLYFGEQRHDDEIALTNVAQFPDLEDEPVLSPLMWSSVGLGVIILLLGVGVLAFRRDAIGFIEIVVGLALIITPFARTWQKRRENRERKAKILAERAAEEARLRELIGAFAGTVKQLRKSRTTDILAQVRREREAIDVPYDAIIATARPILTSILFQLTAQWPQRSAADIAQEFRSVVEAIGITMEDRILIATEVLRRVTWHMIADDRMSDEMSRSIGELAHALEVPDELRSDEIEAITEFRRLRGIDLGGLTARDSELPLGYRESVLMIPTGSRAVKKAEPAPVHITSKRLVIAKKDEIEMSEIYDIELDYDERTLYITHANRKKNLAIRVDRPIEAGRTIDLLAENARRTAVLL